MILLSFSFFPKDASLFPHTKNLMTFNHDPPNIKELLALLKFLNFLKLPFKRFMGRLLEGFLLDLQLRHRFKGGENY